MSLKSCLDEICPHCGSGSEYVVRYVEQHDKDQVALYKEAIELDEDQINDLVGILLSSKYNIFVPWYKKLLIYLKDNFQAQDILEYYKEQFKKVILLITYPP